MLKLFKKAFLFIPLSSFESSKFILLKCSITLFQVKSVEMDIFDLNAVFDLINFSLTKLKQDHSWSVSKDEQLEIVVVHKNVNLQPKFDVKEEPPIIQTQNLDQEPFLPSNQIETFSENVLYATKNGAIIPNETFLIDEDITENDKDSHSPSLLSNPIVAFNDNEINQDIDQSNDDLPTDGDDIELNQFASEQIEQANKRKNIVSSRRKTKGFQSRQSSVRYKQLKKKTKRQVGRPPLFPEIKEDSLGQFPCPFPSCSKSYKQSKDTVAHYKRAHSMVTFQCGECPMQFHERFDMTFHKDTVHNDNEGKFVCSYCGMKFHSRKGLTHHTNRGHPDSAKREAFKCTFCPNKFDSQYDKQQHIYQIHKDKIFFCQHCTKPSFGEKSLESHIKLVHKEILLDCPFCEKRFITGDSLSYHQDEHHDDIETEVNDKPHVCALVGCQKRFRTLLNLELHSKIHVASKARLETIKNSADKTSPKDDKGPCETCGELVAMKRMREHKLQHNMKPFKCSDCDKVFYWRNKLKQHYLAKHVKRELKCPIESCGKVFYVRNVLNAHVKGVHGNTREQCPSCEKSFSFKADLATHIRAVHEGKMSYCSVCMKEFPRNADRNRHERQVHKVADAKSSDYPVSGNLGV